MAQITIESEALDSLKAMAQQLQDERDELLRCLKRAIDEYDSCTDWKVDAKDIVKQCTAKPEILA